MELSAVLQSATMLVSRISLIRIETQARDIFFSIFYTKFRGDTLKKIVKINTIW